MELVELPADDAGRWHDPAIVGAGGLIAFANSPERVEQCLGWGAAAGLQTVNLSDTIEAMPLPTVTPDSPAVGRLAAEHLLSRGLRTLAFTGFEDHHYSRLRAEGFRHAAEEADVPCHELPEGKFTLTGEPKESPLTRWLIDLEKPVGVMTCNDHRGRHVLAALRILRGAGYDAMDSPGDVAVIGVDNDEATCMATTPPLTSVDPDAWRVGHRGAATLHAMLRGEPVPLRQEVTPLGVVERASTGTLASGDPQVALAVAFIERHASEPLDVGTVADNCHTSRRTLERRFRDVLGRTVADVIRHAHARRAKQLLVDTTLPLDRVSDAAGFGTPRQMRMVFAKLVGMPPGEYRSKFRSG